MVQLVGSAVYDAFLSRRDPAEEEMEASGAEVIRTVTVEGRGS